ncbi:MAG: hypothetical protein ACMZ66_15645 [Thalassospira sp.]|uniref:hypothetical protein n=1 Tax=Thalassospira sp. TaxID=1912094 RepID=UPI003A83C2D1
MLIDKTQLQAQDFDEKSGLTRQRGTAPAINDMHICRLQILALWGCTSGPRADPISDQPSSSSPEVGIGLDFGLTYSAAIAI